MVDEQAAVCATQNYALALQGEERNVGYHGRLPKEKGQSTTQSPGTSPPYEVRLRRMNHSVFSAD